jgi:CubicO group peptidase (beta-lactamase class C family)
VTAGSDADDLGALLDDVALPVVDDEAMVGLALGVVRDGGLAAWRGYGWSHLGAARRVVPSTLFRIGSITKTFTAVACLQLVERGLVSLDDPVAEHLRSYRWQQPPRTRPATLRDVLTHTGGVGEFRTWRDALDTTTNGMGLPWGTPAPALAEYYGGVLRAVVAPGERYAYANHAVATLGQVVEDVTGEPFARYVHEQVFAPLGLHRTAFRVTPALAGDVAGGYELRRGRVRSVPWRELAVEAAGSVVSSTDDMARYVAALLGGGANRTGRVLREATLADMFRPHWRSHPSMPGLGLGVELDDAEGHRLVGHDGGVPGFVSSMLVAPDDRVGVLAFCNSGSVAVPALAGQVMRALLDVPQLTTAQARRRVPAAPHLWAELAGVYAPPRGGTANVRLLGLGLELEVLVRDGHLVLRSPVGPLRGGVRLVAVDAEDPLRFETVDASGRVPRLLRVAFARDGAGRIAGLAVGPYRFERRPWLRGMRHAATAAGAGAATAVGLALLSRRAR